MREAPPESPPESPREAPPEAAREACAKALWRPAAGARALRARAALLRRLRAFLDERGLLEVDPPLLAAGAATDPGLASFRAVDPASGAARFLSTSPETHLKRLLAAGSGPVYALTHAFRAGERGRWHNPEFTLLEWYRPGWSMEELMEEVAALLAEVLPGPPPVPAAYGELFQEACGLDPHQAGPEALAAAARAAGIEVQGLGPEAGRGPWLDLLWTHRVEPLLARRGRVFVTAWPAEQAMLAELAPGPDGLPRARRFELYVEGLELANGFQELRDPAEQARRFAADLERRRALGLPQPPVDRAFLEALEAGLPPCAGVALGVDRLLALALGAEGLDPVLPFPWERA
ncbi:MAG: EF-P lysine aminoacylase GenX [Gammaproteobacteria bacterium]|nr:MAG: EF-P lysine aminoacylase GenX [Gammaproteobacteria bacterium]